MTDIVNCRYCGHAQDYQVIRMPTRGLRQNLFLVECGNCHYDIIPVVADHFLKEDDLYEKCKDAWNAVNAVPNVKFSERSHAVAKSAGT